MNSKVEMQIREMKKQTIGVEIEMAEITRNRAIKIVAKHFGTEHTVKHVGGHYDTYTCKDQEGRTWQVMRDVSISASRDNKKAELVAPILHYQDIEELQAIVRSLRKAGAISNPEHGCGVHIHIGANGHTPQTLRNLANMMASREPQLIDALNLDDYRVRRYCRAVDEDFLKRLNQRKPQTMEVLVDIWYKDDFGNRHAHYNSTRYHMLNLHATFTKGIIEFRLFQFDNPTAQKRGGLHAGKLKSYIQLCLALSQQAKMIKTASPKKPQNQNPKCAMRTWMLRLEFIGEEFKTARETFTKALAGDTAFRHGRIQRREHEDR